MPFEEGNTYGKGRPKGSPNKTTQEVRDAYQMFAENNIDKFQEWIDKVAKTNPAKAMELVLSLFPHLQEGFLIIMQMCLRLNQK